MADAGASQRRGVESTGTTIGQSSNLLPVDSSGISYYSSSAGPVLTTDMAAVASRSRETGITSIGVGTEVTGASGSYSFSPLGIRDAHDVPAVPSRAKSVNSPLGLATPESSSAGTSYFSDNFGAMTPFGSTVVAGTTTTTYKLRAKDTGAGYVEWTTTVTPLTTASYPGVPVGVLTDLTVMSWITR